MSGERQLRARSEEPRDSRRRARWEAGRRGLGKIRPRGIGLQAAFHVRGVEDHASGCRPRAGRRRHQLQVARTVMRVGLRLEFMVHARMVGQSPSPPCLVLHCSPSAPDRWIVLKFGGTRCRVAIAETIGGCQTQGEEHSVRGGRARAGLVSALSGVTNELTAIAMAPRQRRRIVKLNAPPRILRLELDADEVLGERWLHCVRWPATRARERTLAWQAEVMGRANCFLPHGCAYLAPASGFRLDGCARLAAGQRVPNQNAWSQRLSVSCRPVADAEWAPVSADNPPHLLTRASSPACDAIPRSSVAAVPITRRLFRRAARRAAGEIWTDVPGMFMPIRRGAGCAPAHPPDYA